VWTGKTSVHKANNGQDKIQLSINCQSVVSGFSPSMAKGITVQLAMSSRTLSRLADKHLTQLREKSGQLADLSNLKSVLERQLGNLEGHESAEAERRARLAASITQIDSQINQIETEIADASRSLKVMGLRPPAMA
jgi:hypothetical protein